MYSVHCTVDNIQFTWRIVETWLHVQCKFYSVECMYGVHQHTVQCAMYNVQCTLYIVQCTWWKEGNLLYSVNDEEYCLGFIHKGCILCTVYIVHCTLSLYTANDDYYDGLDFMHSVHCTLWILGFMHVYNVHCTLYTVQCTLYTVHLHCTM